LIRSKCQLTGYGMFNMSTDQGRIQPVGLGLGTISVIFGSQVS